MLADQFGDSGIDFGREGEQIFRLHLHGAHRVLASGQNHALVGGLFQPPGGRWGIQATSSCALSLATFTGLVI